MSDRVAVFNRGRIAQIDTPENIYARPAMRFVADFVGHANIIEAAQAEQLLGRAGTFALRPEKIRLLARGTASEPGWVTTEGNLLTTQYHGSHTRYEIRLRDGHVIAAQRQNEAEPAPFESDGRVRLAWRPEDMAPLCPDADESP
jgi:putative spermidine/putrescine transport system ATP-binding protein